jgi:hypothetical protein
MPSFEVIDFGDCSKYMIAMHDKMKSLEKNGTFEKNGNWDSHILWNA